MENPWHPDRILHRGAEAVVESGRWFGSPAVRKVRVPKPYRHPALDATLGRARLISELGSSSEPVSKGSLCRDSSMPT